MVELSGIKDPEVSFSSPDLDGLGEVVKVVGSSVGLDLEEVVKVVGSGLVLSPVGSVLSPVGSGPVLSLIHI